jgi:hypothetical protein
MSTFKEFAAHVGKHGVSRTNRFRVIIALPQKLQDKFAAKAGDKKSDWPTLQAVIKIVRIFTGPNSTEFTRGLDLMCSQTELPGKTLNTTECKTNGDVKKIASTITYGNQQFTFKVSSDMFEKNIIDAWMNLIVNPTTHEVGYYSDYATQITIHQLDIQDRIMHTVVLNDAYPVMSNPLVLSNVESNNVHELMTQFAYKSWFSLETQEKATGLVDALSKTPLGPFITPILSNPIVQRGLEYIEQNTGLDLEGEAVNVYNQVNGVVTKATGLSIGRTTSTINQIKVKMEGNPVINGSDKTKLTGYINGLLGKIGG